VKYYVSNQTSKHFGAKLSITIQLVKLVKRSSCQVKTYTSRSRTKILKVQEHLG